MSGVKQLATVAIDREALYHAAGELATHLRAELPRLLADARRLRERLPRFAGDIVVLHQRCARLLQLAEAVAGGTGTSTSSGSSRGGHPGATISTGRTA